MAETVNKVVVPPGLPPTAARLGGAVRHYSSMTFSDALWEMLTLRAAVHLISSRDSMKGPYENICLISTLLLTMISLSPVDVVGEALPGYDEEHAGNTYTMLAFISYAFLFGCSLLSSFIVLLANVLASDEEAIVFAARAGLMFKATLVTFGSGLVCFLVSTSWQLLTLLPSALAILVPAVIFIGFVGYIIVDGVRVMYDIEAARRDTEPAEPTSKGATLML